ncbi:substrate-binding domain-containing protein [Pseudactinotalea suaedae]|uniref:substrate-binding domain-containing protein n=1 Tax=Pseudactinotalea suaedae TaxID=1524924 RepID=UPI0012E28B50|nr:substrate-binding domain-containing protein [Pseudactinotalea suaedae]
MSEDGTASAESRALGASRRSEVLAAVRRHGTVRVAELAAQFDVTPVTIRRDLADLDEAGLVTRVHGGAIVAAEGPRDDAPAARRIPQPGRGDGAIGLLVPSLSVYWPDIARSVESEVRRAGLRLLLRESRYRAADERPDLDWLVDSGCLGLLAAPTMDGVGGERAREWLRDAPVPVVLVERTAVVDDYQRAIESVVSDHALGGEMATHHLANLGHRRIGAVLSRTSPHFEEIRLGWDRAVAELRLASDVTVDEVPERASEDFDPALEVAVDHAVANGTTGLLVHSDPEAVRLAQLATTRGLRIPEDLSIVSYDDEVAALGTPPLTALRPPRQEVGRTAVTMLLERLADPDRPTHRVAISPTLVVRDSTGAPVTR